MKKKPSSIAILAAVAASAASPLLLRAGTSTNTAGPVQQGQSDGNSSGNPALNNAAVTISFAGQTALRNFNNSGYISLLQPGTSIVLHNGGIDGTSPVTYYAPSATNGAATVQLARTSFLTSDTGVGATSISTAASSQQHSALRLEWQEKGSLDGFYDLINDQIGYTQEQGPVSLYNGRGPSVSNPIWINNNAFTGTSGTTVSIGSGTGKTIGGHVLNSGTGINYYDTYKNNSSFGSAQVYDALTGRNLQGGANRIQFAVGENSAENFAYAGTPNPFLKPGDGGYGQGNPALTSTPLISGLGVANSRQQFFGTEVANLSTDKVDPQSATGQTYAPGPWNNAGAANIDSKQIAATAVTISANPGTGLERLNQSDAQWIQTAGRLANGADFNTVSRVASTGQRNVLAVATGIDPTWAVGENDGGDTTQTSAANAQSNIGSSLRFSGKTSGSFSAKAIAQNRLAIGALSLAENRGNITGAAPVRALDIDFNDAVDPTSGGSIDLSKFTRLNFDSFVNLTYKAVLISHYNTVKAPNPAYANATAAQWASLTSDQTGIKGDPYGDVQAFIANITNSESSLVSGSPVASISTPADGLLSKGYFLPSLLNYKRVVTGGALTPNVLTDAQQQLQSFIAQAYPEIFTAEQTPGAAVYGTHDQTIGSNAYYGSQNVGGLTINGGSNSVRITAKTFDGTNFVAAANKVATPYGNYLLGNFNQDGRRDFSSVKQALNAALSLHVADAGGVNSMYVEDGGVSNSTPVTPLDSPYLGLEKSGASTWGKSADTKGDLIILGDANGDGRFDGADLKFLARGQSLADTADSEHLTTLSGAAFADQIRNPNAVIRKNAALDFLRDHTADVNDVHQTFLRKTAESPQAQANDAASNYLNAFNKFDIDHNGKVDRNDAAIVDKFIGRDYKNLSQQLAATINDPFGDSNQFITSGAQVQFNLVDANLTDGKSVIDQSDFALVRAAVGNKLLNGDANFDGSVNFADLVAVAQHYGDSGGSERWDQGDFNGDGKVDFADLVSVAQNYGASSDFQADLAAAFASVPEPGSLVLLAAILGLGRPRGRRRRAS